jgi:hypothetical protein
MKVMVSPVRQVTWRVDVGLGVFVAEGVLVGARVKVGMGRRVAVGNGRRVAKVCGRVAVGRGQLAVGDNIGVVRGETNSPLEMLTGETVAVGGNGCGVAVAVSVICSVRVRVAVGVQVGDGDGDGVADGCVVAVGCGVSVVRATRPSRGAPRIRASTARKAQPAKTTSATSPRPPPTANHRRAVWRVCCFSAAL